VSISRIVKRADPDMGDNAQGRQPETPFRPLVAFDFDGTLTSHDSFIAFLRWRGGAGAWLAGLAVLAPAGLRYLADRDRGRIKAAAVKRFLAGLTRAELEAEAQRFATDRGRALLRPDALRAWRRWQREGARCVIVTASPELTVAPFARALGADRLLGTRLALDAGDRLTGALVGLNCRGAEKVRRLKEAFGDDVALEAAYGDTDGDREMLALAEEKGFRVFNGKGRSGPI
jgi:phosphatidylglycerophosphatase C